MAKLVLGKTPKTFKPFTVKFELPEGGEDQILVTFKYKTRTEFAEFLNTLFSEAGVEATDQTGQRDFVELYRNGGEKTVKHLTEILDAWDLTEPINAANLAALHNQAPAAAAALTAAYSGACSEGRLGN